MKLLSIIGVVFVLALIAIISTFGIVSSGEIGIKYNYGTIERV